MKIIKTTGETQTFSKKKLKDSLIKSGLNERKASEISSIILKKLHKSPSSKKIFSATCNQLKAKHKRVRANYSLKRALQQLGPTGYHFESFISEVFRSLGFNTTVSVMAKGRCVEHEIDVVAKSSKENHFVECKFHNSIQQKNDIKTALYIHARSLDLKENRTNKFKNYWLATNTALSKDALTYSKCVGLKTIALGSADYNLYELIDKLSVYPITVLSNLNKANKESLLKRDIITCRQLKQNFYKIKNSLNLDEKALMKLEQEVYILTEKK